MARNTENCNREDVKEMSQTAISSSTRFGSLSAGVSRVPAIHLIYVSEVVWPRGYDRYHVQNDSDHISVVALHSVSGHGCLHIECDGNIQEVRIQSPSVVFCSVRHLNRILSVDGHWHVRWYEFEPSEDLSNWLFRPIGVHEADSDDATFQSIKQHISSNRGNDLVYAAALFTELIFRWLRDSELDLRNADQQIVDTATAAFRKGIHDGVTVESVSAEVGVHASSLRRLFHLHLRMSPKQYLDRLRYGEAKRLLQQGMLIKQVSGSLGFENQSQFSRFFKSRGGVAPREYRNRYHAKS